jgi:tetratricopeptide (TPR) repeat protein
MLAALQAAAPELIVLVGDAAQERGAAQLRVLSQQRGAESIPVVVICALQPGALEAQPLPYRVGILTTDCGMLECARRIRALLGHLVTEGLSGSLQQLVDTLSPPTAAGSATVRKLAAPARPAAAAARNVPNARTAGRPTQRRQATLPMGLPLALSAFATVDQDSKAADASGAATFASAPQPALKPEPQPLAAAANAIAAAPAAQALPVDDAEEAPAKIAPSAARPQAAQLGAARQAARAAQRAPAEQAVAGAPHAAGQEQAPRRVMNAVMSSSAQDVVAAEAPLTAAEQPAPAASERPHQSPELQPAPFEADSLEVPHTARQRLAVLGARFGRVRQLATKPRLKLSGVIALAAGGLLCALHLRHVHSGEHAAATALGALARLPVQTSVAAPIVPVAAPEAATPAPDSAPAKPPVTSAHAPEQTPQPMAAEEQPEPAGTEATSAKSVADLEELEPEPVSKANPKFVRARRFAAEGRSLMKNGHLGLAEAAYLKALQARPNYPQVMAALVRVHLQREDGSEAVRWAKRLIAKQPKRGVNQLLLGDAQALRGDAKAARAAWLRAARLGNAQARARLRR